MAKYGNFGLITNGLWYKQVNITDKASGIKDIFVPLDSYDENFYDSTTVRGNTYNPTTTPGLARIDAPHVGAPINYVVAGSNLPASTQCILIDVYYNVEVIPSSETAAFLKASSNVVPQEISNAVKTQLAATVQTGGLTNYVQPIVNFAKKAAPYIKPIVSQINPVAGAFVNTLI